MIRSCFSALLLILLSTHAEARFVNNGSSNYDSPQLRFVAQLSLNGCALFVHDTGASDGPHLAVEPLMCVTSSLDDYVLPRFDAVTQQTYVSVPVLLRDEDVLEEVRRNLSHLAPKSVSFAPLISVSAFLNSTLNLDHAAVVWNKVERVAYLRIFCRFDFTESCRFESISLGHWPHQQEILSRVFLNATILVNGTAHELPYRVTLQNHTSLDTEFITPRFQAPPQCRQLRFIRSVLLPNCTVRVHQRMDMKGHFLMEPLLCHDMSSLSSESVLYDYSRDMYYLKLDVLLQDEDAADAVRTQLADLGPRSVSFMRLWRARSEVSDVLRARFEVGKLMVSTDRRTAQLKVYAGTRNETIRLKSGLLRNPIDLWRHLTWSVTSLVADQCLLTSPEPTYSWRMQETAQTPDASFSQSPCPRGLPCKYFHRKQDGRSFVVIQQRLRGGFSFQQNWETYVKGFGDATDFWIGLRRIHQLTGDTPRLLRVEAVTWSNSLYVAEYSGFSVAGASSQYSMTFREYLSGRSNATHDSLSWHKGMKFSTKDRDNDGWSQHCSQRHGGHGGWWFNQCADTNPNGLYHGSADKSGQKYMHWYGTGNTKAALQSIRLMLQL